MTDLEAILRVESTNCLQLAAATGSPPGGDASHMTTVSGWGKLPAELKNIIIKFAMTANGAKISMPCLKEEVFSPNAAAKALRVNQHFYHEGVRCLYGNNEVIFDHFGSDLKSMCKIWKHCGVASPLFNEVKFYVGDQRYAQIGYLKANAFRSVLQQLDTTFRVRHLKIIFEPYNFAGLAQVKAFASSLGHVDVADTLELMAIVSNIDLAIDDFTQALKMDSVAMETKIEECDVLGVIIFHAIYRRTPEVNKEEISAQEGHSVLSVIQESDEDEPSQQTPIALAPAEFWGEDDYWNHSD